MTGTPQSRVQRYTGDPDELIALLQLSMGIESLDGVRRLMAVERARGTRYYVAVVGDRIVGVVGLWFDPTGETAELEPPQIIDVAVSPEYRRRGIARALMERAVRETSAAGYDRLWLYTDGNSHELLTFYRGLGFRLVSAVPDWFGDGSVKAILSLDFR
jgi:ribosomal protein S18 acetylase RimI-like enzyme